MKRPAMEDTLDDAAMAASAAVAVERWLRAETRAGVARITRFERLPGGAIQDNWALDAHIEGGPWHGEHALVLRADAPSKVAASLTRAQEFAVLRIAHAGRCPHAEAAFPLPGRFGAAARFFHSGAPAPVSPPVIG